MAKGRERRGGNSILKLREPGALEATCTARPSECECGSACRSSVVAAAQCDTFRGLATTAEVVSTGRARGVDSASWAWCGWNPTEGAAAKLREFARAKSCSWPTRGADVALSINLGALRRRMFDSTVGVYNGTPSGRRSWRQPAGGGGTATAPSLSAIGRSSLTGGRCERLSLRVVAAHARFDPAPMSAVRRPPSFAGRARMEATLVQSDRPPRAEWDCCDWS
eukprot:scaffold16444_cov29-Tisochrysis_lutea.AAC.9